MTQVSELGFELIVRGGTCVTPGGRIVADIGIRGGRIVALGELTGAPAQGFVDARGLHVLPGVIDGQVNFREPGEGDHEDLATGTTAAVLGGVTAVLEMPNTEPPTTTAAALADRVEGLKRRARCDVGFFVGATGQNADDLNALEAHPGCAGVKVVMGSSTGTLLVPDDAELARVLACGSRRVAIHAEDEARLHERRPLTAGGVAAHPEWRDPETAFRATWRVLALARRFGRRLHMLHVTTAEELDLLVDCKDIATCEVTPQHLTLAAPECYQRLGTRAQINPPLRDRRHQEALWRGIANGLVDMIATDHAPHTVADKARAYPESPSGMPGVQTLVPVMLDHVAAGRLSLERLVDLVCAGPARVWGLAGKGRLAVGCDGDLTVVDLGARREIKNQDQASRCGWTPFDGMQVTGWPIATVVRGRLVMRDGELVGDPIGRPVRFVETLVHTPSVA